MPRTTQKAPQKPRKPAGATQGRKTPQRPTTGQRRGKPNAKANVFDAIAAGAVTGESASDLTQQLQRSLDAKGKAKRSVTDGRGRSDDGKVDAKPARTATTTYKSRPTAILDTIAQRAREIGLRPRRNGDGTFDVAGIAARLRATEPAIREWLGARIAQPATAKGKATTARAATKVLAQQWDDKPPKAAKPKLDDIIATVQLGHVWAERQPPWLSKHTLVVRYRLHRDGSVTSLLYQVLDPDGKVLEDFWRPPLDYRPTVEVDGRNRPIKLNPDPKALEAWILKQGLASAEDIHVK